MRKEMLLESECRSMAVAVVMCPWAETIIVVDGGYLAFESDDDAETWRNQE